MREGFLANTCVLWWNQDRLRPAGGRRNYRPRRGGAPSDGAHGLLLGQSKSTPFKIPVRLAASDPSPPPPLQELGLIRKPASFMTSICDERGQELIYAGMPITEVFKEEMGLGGVLGLLWFQRRSEASAVRACVGAGVFRRMTVGVVPAAGCRATPASSSRCASW